MPIGAKLRYLLRQYDVVDGEVKAIQEELAEQLERRTGLAARICKLMRNRTTVAGTTYTPVRGSSTVIDEVRLRRALGAAAWRKVTKTSLDRDALAKEIAAGRIDATVVAQCSADVPRTPYLRVTRRKD